MRIIWILLRQRPIPEKNIESNAGGSLVMHRVSCLFFLGFTLCLLSSTGCMISHSGCDAARGPLMFGAPCGSYTGCGDQSIASGINHTPKKNAGCSECDRASSGHCKSCSPVATGLKRILRHRADSNCDGANEALQITCGVDHISKCDGCDQCLEPNPVCGIEEASCGIEVPKTRVVLPHQGRAVGITDVPRIAPSIKHHSMVLNNAPKSEQKYPMDTPRIFKNRATFHDSSR